MTNDWLTDWLTDGRTDILCRVANTTKNLMIYEKSRLGNIFLFDNSFPQEAWETKWPRMTHSRHIYDDSKTFFIRHRRKNRQCGQEGSAKARGNPGAMDRQTDARSNRRMRRPTDPIMKSCESRLNTDSTTFFDLFSSSLAPLFLPAVSFEIPFLPLHPGLEKVPFYSPFAIEITSWRVTFQTQSPFGEQRIKSQIQIFAFFFFPSRN